MTENGYSPTEYGRLTERVDYLVKCCDDSMKKFDRIEQEQVSAKNRTIATLVGIVVSLAFLVLNYFTK